jgi:hypothetical protein
MHMSEKQSEDQPRQFFKPQQTEVTKEDKIQFGFIPDEITEADFGKEWWPQLEGFPKNIMYASIRRGEGERLVAGSTLYEPYLESFCETESARELAYRNKYGGNHWVQVLLKKSGAIEIFKYNGEELIAVASGKELDSVMRNATMVGLHDGERCRFEHLKF